MNLFQQALTLSHAFYEVGLALRPLPSRIHNADGNTDGNTLHFAELTPTGIILLYATNPYSLDLYDTLFTTIGTTRTAIETDSSVTVFTYRRD